MEPLHLIIIYPLLLTALAWIAIPLLPAAGKAGAGLLVVLLNALSTSVVALKALTDQDVNIILDGGFVFGDIALRTDPLSAWFILIVNLTCLHGAWYGVHYTKAYLTQRSNLSLHWSVFVLFHISMSWVCTAQHGLAFLVAWEMMSLSALLLVMFDHNRFNTLNAGINYLVQAHIGVAFLTVAVVWVRASEGSFDFHAIEVFLGKPGANWVTLLFFTGFAIKAGFIPLHTWLPHAHPAAPAHISGVLSGVMVTMGIYGLLRIAALLTSHLVITGALLLMISGLTAFYGILSGTIHRDYKRLLAFSTIENMGIIGMGIGLGLIGKGIEDPALIFFGFSAAILHTLSHSLYKPLLFFASGNLYQATHTRNMEHLGGLIKKLPVTAFFFLCGALAVSGLPPFNGFVSKFLLFIGLLKGISLESFPVSMLMMAGVIALALVGGLSVLTFSRAFSIIFLGKPRSEIRYHPTEGLTLSQLPFFSILFFMLLIALSPALFLGSIERIVFLFDPGILRHPPLTDVGASLGSVGITTFLFILIAGAVFIVRTKIVSRRGMPGSPTWSGGYHRPSPTMQYTGKSFSKNLAKLFPFLTSEQKRYNEIPRTTVFPSGRSYQSNYAEFFEKNIISKAVNHLLSFMNYFSFIHNGSVQYYVLYGFIFLLILIVATVFNLL